MKVYAPSADIPVLLKIEQSSTGVNTELTMNTTVANAWKFYLMILVLSHLIYMIGWL